MHQKAARIIRRAQIAASYIAAGDIWGVWDSSRRREMARRYLLRLLPQHSVGAELGVFKGDFSVEILGRVNPRELHLVDEWDTVGEFYPDWSGLSSEWHRRSDFGRLRRRDAYEQAVRKITEVNRDNAKLVFHIGDDLAYLRTLPDGYFDWIYIDTDHSYEQTTAELAIAAVKVHPGGLIGGSDWTDIQDEDPFATFHTFPHSVARAAQEFLAAHVGYFELKYLRGGEWVMGPPAGQAQRKLIVNAG